MYLLKIADAPNKSLPKILLAAAFALLVVFQATAARAQEKTEETISVRTRVVFVDVSVRDKRTSEPVTNLTAEDFEIFDDGKPRAVSYFGRENDGKRPLALLLVLAPLDDGAGKNLRAAGVVKSLAAALAKLPAADEAAVMLVWRSGVNRLLVDLTADRAKVTEAIAALPEQGDTKERKLRPPKVIQETALSIAARRPGSQVNVVLLTDSVFLVSDAESDEMTLNFTKANATLNALVTGTDLFFNLMSPILKPAENDLKARWYDVPQRIAKQTGGDYVRVRKKKDYGAALERLIGNVAARYSIGFALEDGEADDGRMHRLEVKVKARDSQGKKRELEVSAREGYYAPKNR